MKEIVHLDFEPRLLSRARGRKTGGGLNWNKDFSFRQIDSQTGEKCSYRKLANESIRLALWLKKQEINPGDIVSICSDHRIAIWSPFCATLFIGANLNIWYDHWSRNQKLYLPVSRKEVCSKKYSKRRILTQK